MKNDSGFFLIGDWRVPDVDFTRLRKKTKAVFNIQKQIYVRVKGTRSARALCVETGTQFNLYSDSLEDATIVMDPY